MRPLQAHCHFGLGILYNPDRPSRAGRAELFHCSRAYRAMEMTFWLELAEMALGQRKRESNMPKIMKIAATAMECW